MSEFYTSEYITDTQRELNDQVRPQLVLTPWVVQNIVYELIANHFASNDPAQMGYTFEQRYNPSKEKSQIFLDIAYNWKADVANKRPGIFVERGEASYNSPTMKQLIGSNIAESETDHFAYVTLPISVTVVAGPVGFVEQLADYVKYPFLYFSQQIQNDFCFQKFRMKKLGAPKLLENLDAKDHFSIEIPLEIVFIDSWRITGDHLKLKTISLDIIDKITKKPLERQ